MMKPCKECGGPAVLIQKSDCKTCQGNYVRADICAEDDQTERLCQFALDHGFSTGHADTMKQALDEILPQIGKALSNPAQVQAVDAWHDIATAPRDGTKVFLCVPGENLHDKTGSVARTIGYYAPKFTLPAHEDVYEPEKFPKAFEYNEADGGWFAVAGFYATAFENNYGDEVAISVKPTHWQPLPQPPKK